MRSQSVGHSYPLNPLFCPSFCAKATLTFGTLQYFFVSELNAFTTLLLQKLKRLLMWPTSLKKKSSTKTLQSFTTTPQWVFRRGKKKQIRIIFNFILFSVWFFIFIAFIFFSDFSFLFFSFWYFYFFSFLFLLHYFIGFFSPTWIL